MNEEEQYQLFGDEWVLIDREEAIKLVAAIIDSLLEEKTQPQ